MDRIVRAAVNSWNGLRAAARGETAFREEIWLLAASVPLGYAVATSAWVWLSLVAVVLVVMIVELLNTGIEKLCDRVTIAHDAKIGMIKDMGSAAVGLALVLAGLVWLTALAERFGLI